MLWCASILNSLPIVCLSLLVTTRDRTSPTLRLHGHDLAVWQDQLLPEAHTDYWNVNINHWTAPTSETDSLHKCYPSSSSRLSFCSLPPLYSSLKEDFQACLLHLVSTLISGGISVHNMSPYTAHVPLASLLPYTYFAPTTQIHPPLIVYLCVQVPLYSSVPVLLTIFMQLFIHQSI